MEYNNEETVFESAAKSEETVLNEGTAPQKQSVDSTEVHESQSESQEKAEESRKPWKEVVIGGTSGIAIGAAGILFSGFTLPEEATIPGIIGENENDDNENEPAPAPQDNHIEVATCVNDDMSFNEAFAAARHEVGANGAFVWHGQVYTTCYAEEWNAMTSEQQAQFSHDAVAAVHGENAQDTVSDGTHTGQEDTHTPEDGSDGIEVAVLGVDENVVTEDGEIINVGYAEVEGHSAIFIDTDADGTFDLMAADVNDDGYIDVDSEVSVIDEANITVEDFQGTSSVSDPVDDLYAQAPDYTNDADVSSFA